VNEILIFLFLITFLSKVYGQDQTFPQDPQEAKFITTDIQNFWKAFDAMDSSTTNPFEDYLKQGTAGLRGFIPDRIISADSLLAMVRRKRNDYEKVRDID